MNPEFVMGIEVGVLIGMVGGAVIALAIVGFLLKKAVIG